MLNQREICHKKNKKEIEPKKEVVKKLKRNRKEVLEVSNTFSVLSDSEPSSKNNKTELDNKSDIEYIKSIKASKRTPEEKKLLENFRKRAQRQNESEIEKTDRREKDKEQKNIQRENETEDISLARRKKDQEQKKMQRGNVTEARRKVRQ